MSATITTLAFCVPVRDQAVSGVISRLIISLPPILSSILSFRLFVRPGMTERVLFEAEDGGEEQRGKALSDRSWLEHRDLSLKYYVILLLPSSALLVDRKSVV